MIYLRCNAEKCYCPEKGNTYAGIIRQSAGAAVTNCTARRHNGIRKAEEKSGLAVSAVNEAVVILPILRQWIIADNFMLLAMWLVRMQSARRRERLSHLGIGQRSKRHKRCHEKQREKSHNFFLFTIAVRSGPGMQVIIQPDALQTVFYAAAQVSEEDFTPVSARIL